MHLKAIHTSNLGEKPLNPIQLLNALAETSLMVIFPNCCVALRIYCTLPVNTLFCRLRNELDRKYAPIRMQFESSQQ